MSGPERCPNCGGEMAPKVRVKLDPAVIEMLLIGAPLPANQILGTADCASYGECEECGYEEQLKLEEAAE